MTRSVRSSIVAALLLLLWSNGAQAQAVIPVTVVVLSIEDGDSLRIMFGRVEKSLRLDAVQVAPCMNADAAARLYGLAAGRAALLDYDQTLYATTGELAGYLRVDSVQLNLMLVAEGFAVRSGGAPNPLFDRDARTAQLAAQADGLGLWWRCPPRNVLAFGVGQQSALHWW